MTLRGDRPTKRATSPRLKGHEERRRTRSPPQYPGGGRARLPSLDEAIPEMSHLRKDSSCELAKLSCRLSHDPRGPDASISPSDVIKPPSDDCLRIYEANLHGHLTPPFSPFSSPRRPLRYEEQSQSSFYEDQPRYAPRHGSVADLQRNMSPQYEDNYPSSRSSIQLPIHSGPPNRNSCSSSSSTDFSDRRTSLASGSTATTCSGPTDRLGRSNGNSPESRTLAPIRTCESTFGTRRNSLLLQQPCYEQGRGSCYEQVRESVEYTRESPDYPQPATRRPASRQTVDRQHVNFAKADDKLKRRRGNLPKSVTEILKTWFSDHIAHPYPSEEEKQELMCKTGLSMSQVSNWFINARRRNLPQLNKQAAAESALREQQGISSRRRSRSK